MIVNSMTPEEVYRDIERDIWNVAAWWTKQRKARAKRALKLLAFPNFAWYDYQSHRHNRFLVLSGLFGRKYNNSNFTAVFVLQKKERGFAVYCTRFPWQFLADRIVFMPHLFDRYAERYKVKLTGIELIKYFLQRNCYGEPADGKYSGRSVRYKERDNYCLSVHDGVLLGEMKDDIFIASTFITYEMANGLQRVEFERSKDKMLDISGMQKEMCRIYKQSDNYELY